RATPPLEVDGTTGPLGEPARRERDVPDLVSAHDALDRRGIVIADLLEPRVVALAVVEVAALEAEAEQCHELQRIATLRHALPEPVAHREVADRESEARQMTGIESHVPQLVTRDAQEAAPEAFLGIREGEHGPAHQLGGLELVV